MILTCPSCETQYFADDDSIGDSGRSVKCAACGHSWHVHGSGGIEEDVPATVAGGAHEAYRERVRERKRRKSRLAATSAWFSTALASLLIVGGLVVFRNDVVRVWPQAAEAYKAAGLEVNRFGLDFVSVDASRTFDGTMPILTISGTVTNVTAISQPGSSVRIGLRDEVGAEVASLIAPMDTSEIAPGASANFSTRLENPPVEAFDLELSFVAPDGGFSLFRGAGRVGAAEPDTTLPAPPLEEAPSSNDRPAP
ncbi:MAG: MJ0042-type zinc finger domain-containing protein [Pseudomonadota bacterium]